MKRGVGAAMERLVARRGRLDILVNCAGVTGPTKRIEDCSLAEWRRTVEINQPAPSCAAGHAVPQMRRQNAGRIVNLASIAGKEGNASMTTIRPRRRRIALTKALDKELADTEVRVNCVAPAVIATDLVKQWRPKPTTRSSRRSRSDVPAGPRRSPPSSLGSHRTSLNWRARFDLSGRPRDLLTAGGSGRRLASRRCPSGP